MAVLLLAVDDRRVLDSASNGTTCVIGVSSTSYRPKNFTTQKAEPGATCLCARDVVAGQGPAPLDVPAERLHHLLGVPGHDVAHRGSEVPRAQDVEDLLRAGQVGAVVSVVRRGSTLLDAVAAEVERDPGGRHTPLALHVRHEVEQVVEEVLRRAGRLTGATPLCRDASYARRVADLTVYVRQQHAESDLEHLGTLAIEVP